MRSFVCPKCHSWPCICNDEPRPDPHFKCASRHLAPTLLALVWWVQIYSGNQWLHGGHYATRAQCETAKVNLLATHAALGYKNLRGFCVTHDPGNAR